MGALGGLGAVMKDCIKRQIHPLFQLMFKRILY